MYRMPLPVSMPPTEFTFFPPTPMERVRCHSDEDQVDPPAVCIRHKTAILTCLLVAAVSLIISVLVLIDGKTTSNHVSTGAPVLTPSLGASMLGIEPLTTTPLPTHINPPRLVVTETAPHAIAVVSFTSVSAAATIQERMAHELGTAHVRLSMGLTADTRPLALRLHGEIVPTDAVPSNRDSRGTVNQLVRELGGSVDIGLESQPQSCIDTSLPDRGPSTLGVYIHIACIAVPIATPHTPIVCAMSLEIACLAPGRDRLPSAIRYDRHVEPWVFEYLVS